MIGELHYQKRILEQELFTVRQQALDLLAENSDLKEQVAAQNEKPKRKRPVITND